MNRRTKIFNRAHISRTALLLVGLIVAGLMGCASQAPSPEVISVPSEKIVSRELSSAATADYARAQQLLRAGELAKAQPLLAEVTRKSAGFMPAWVQYAQTLSAAGDFTSAVKAINHARKLGPEDAAMFNIAGVIYTGAGDLKMALAAHLAAVKMSPNCAECQFNLGRFYDIYHQDIARALVHYQAYLDNSAGHDEDLVNWVDELKRNLARQAP